MEGDKKTVFRYEPWYKWGVLVLYIEMFIAIGVSVFSLYFALTGHAGFLKH